MFGFLKAGGVNIWQAVRGVAGKFSAILEVNSLPFDRVFGN